VNTNARSLTQGNPSYAKLIASIKVTLMHGLIAAQKALEYQRLKTYWQIGQKISRAVDTSKGAMEFGERLYQDLSRRLSRDLKVDISADTLYRAILFYRDHPQFPEKTTLTFTHYIALHRVSDPKKRAALEKKAIKKEWSSVRLKDEIARINAQAGIKGKPSSGRLNAERGELYVYKLLPQSDLQGRRRLVVDCGFKIYVPLDGQILKNRVTTRTEQKRVVKTEKDEGAYQVRLHKKYSANLYTYLARVLRVIDGDTLDMSIDAGFGIFTEQRARLKGVNAPEAKTRAGKAARAFMKRYLSRCPLVVIRTQKAGMYGRWLADVFALPKAVDPQRIAAEGEFLNQRLLDEGLAERYGSGTRNDHRNI
jgi:micrococcal nuclease